MIDDCIDVAHADLKTINSIKQTIINFLLEPNQPLQQTARNHQT